MHMMYIRDKVIGDGSIMRVWGGSDWLKGLEIRKEANRITIYNAWNTNRGYELLALQYDPLYPARGWWFTQGNSLMKQSDNFEYVTAEGLTLRIIKLGKRIILNYGTGMGGIILIGIDLIGKTFLGGEFVAGELYDWIQGAGK